MWHKMSTVFDVSDDRNKDTALTLQNTSPGKANDANKILHLPTLQDKLVQFAEGSSLHGVSRVAKSDSLLKRLLWALFLSATLIYLIYQLCTLWSYYNSYPIKTTVHLKYEPLQFPSITICNLNPIRASKARQHGSKVMKKLIDYYNRKYRNLHPPAESEPSEIFMQDNISSFKDVFAEELFNMSLSLNEDERDENSNSASTSLPPPPYEYGDSPPKSSFNPEFLIKQIVSKEFQTINRIQRKRLGHQIDQMVMQCYFAGKKCKRSVKNTITSEYGNCYTYDSDQYISTQSGPEYGLEIVLNLENNEVLGSINKGHGARLVIHEPGTFPLPAEKGITISSGFETTLAIRMVKITRLGYPYGHCMKTLKFSTQACWLKCKEELIINLCGCEFNHIKTEMKYFSGHDVQEKYPDCRNSKNTSRCVRKISNEFLRGKYPCNCHNLCEETQYNAFFSGRLWPSSEYLSELRTKACDLYENKSECQIPEDVESLRMNFLKVIVYYEDLNFESLTEEPMYDSTALLSDIGGSVGLFVGASVLSGCELLELVTDCIYILYLRFKRRKTYEMQ